MRQLYRPRRAFSLIETLVTLVLVSAVLGLLAELVAGYSQALQFSNKKDQSLQAVQVALKQIRKELADSILVVAPIPGSLSVTSILSFQTIDPASSTRLPFPLPSPSSASWNPADSAQILKIRYLANQDALIREVTFPDATVAQDTLLFGLNSLAFSNLADGNVQLKISMQELKRVSTFTTEVFLHVK